MSLPPLPPGWVTATDPISGNLYWANPLTGQTSWQFPPITGINIPPPPPPQPVREPPFRKPPPHAQENSMRTHLTSTLNSTGLLVPSARAIINKSYNEKAAGSGAVPAELQMDGGMIADLATVQSNYRREQGQVENPYESLKPFEMPISLSMEQASESRLDVRLMNLMDALDCIKSNNSE